MARKTKIQPLAELMEMVGHVFRGQRPHHLRWGREMAYGMLVSHTLSLTRIADSLREKAQRNGTHSTAGRDRRIIHTIKRLSRNLRDDRMDDKRLNDRLLATAAEYMRTHDDSQWVLALDTTDLGHPYSQPWLPGGMELTYQVRDGSRRSAPKEPGHSPTRGSATKHRGYNVVAISGARLDKPGVMPLVQHLYSHAESRLQHTTWHGVALEQVARVLPHMPEDAVLVADRGFDYLAFRQGLDELPIKTWAIRVRTKRRDKMASKVIDRTGKVHKLGDFADDMPRPHRVRLDEGVQRKIRATYNYGMRQIWVRDSARDLASARRVGQARTLITATHPKGATVLTLLVNRKVGRKESAQLIKAYMQRWTLEEQFRQSKSESVHGFAMESTARVRKFLGQQRMLFLQTLVSTYLAAIALSRPEAARSLAGRARTAGAVPPNIMYRLTQVIGRMLDGAPRWTARRWFVA